MTTKDRLELIALEGTNPNQHVYALKGPLTLGNLFTVQEALRSDAPVLILDLAGVPFIDSAGIGALVQCFVSRTKQGKRLVLTGPNDMVTKTFKATKVDTLLETYPTLDAVK
jgi:anti-sigma B factor antagonist